MMRRFLRFMTLPRVLVLVMKARVQEEPGKYKILTLPSFGLLMKVGF